MKKNAFRMGLSMEEFWLDNPQNYFLRLDVYNEESKKHIDELDYLAWRTAYYTMLGTQQSLAVKRVKIFPDKPLCYQEEQKKKQGSLKDRIMAGIERHNAYIRAKKALQGESNNG